MRTFPAVNEKVDHDGRGWVVCQIQPDHQLVCLQNPTRKEEMRWTRYVSGTFLPYDITQGRPMIEIPASSQAVLNALDRQLRGDDPVTGKPRKQNE